MTLHARRCQRLNRWQVLFWLPEHDAEEDGEQGRGQNAPLLDFVGNGEAAWQWPTVLHLTLLTVMELAEDGEKFWGELGHARIFQSPLQLTVSKALVRSTKAWCRPISCSLQFYFICLSMKFMCVVPLFDLDPHWLCGTFYSSLTFCLQWRVGGIAVVLTVWFLSSFFFLIQERVIASLRSCGCCSYT